MKAPKVRKPPSKRTIRLAAKVSASDGCSPARLQVKNGNFWTLQWSELAALARAIPTLTRKRKPKEKG